MLTPAQAEEQIARHLPCLPIESLPVSHCAGDAGALSHSRHQSGGGLEEAQSVCIALGEAVTFNTPLTGFLPVATDTDEWARPWARPVAHNGSGDFSALAGTCGFVELPPGPNTYPKGFVTKLYRW